jgi:hypothetical protein
VLPLRHGLVGLRKYVKRILKKKTFHQSQQTWNSVQQKRKFSQEDTEATESFITGLSMLKYLNSSLMNNSLCNVKENAIICSVQEIPRIWSFKQTLSAVSIVICRQGIIFYWSYWIDVRNRITQTPLTQSKLGGAEYCPRRYKGVQTSHY